MVERREIEGEGILIEKDRSKKETKNQKRKMKKKRRNQRKREEENSKPIIFTTESDTDNQDIQIEYIPEEIEIDLDNPQNVYFLKIMEKFKITEVDPKLEEELRKEREKAEKEKELLTLRKKPKDIDEELDDDEQRKEDDDKKDDPNRISKRKLKKLNRLSIAELKQQVTRPDVVEMHDVTAKDPKLLVHLKAYRNTVPVPRHWCFKRKYLQGKRGIEKPPFQLPDFIKKTGIMEMRQALQDKEEQKTLKAKMREKVRPKLGKIDIDYQKLHDAFFKWQTKPKMTIHGDLYYEGKEYETKLKEKKPGDLSDDLKTALGMPVGSNSNRVPPPWLIAMQRYGPPPSYPNLKIPGLNAPIPDGCSFGYHAGGWGKPPVDEMGRPLYGDVFGTLSGDNQSASIEDEVEKGIWGELESESESESEEEEEEEEEEEGEKGEADTTGIVTPAEGLVTPSGLTSIPLGMETPDLIELRKRKIEQEMEGGDTPALYTILPEKKVEKMGGAMMASAHTYDLSAAMPGKTRSATGGAVDSGIEIALDPSELELDHAAMAAHYEQRIREQNMLEKDHDLSDMVAEHAAKQKNKRKKQVQDVGGKSNPKKYKEFKF